MEAVKRRRLNSEGDVEHGAVFEQQTTKNCCLTSINDYCVLKIFEYVELNDLCELGKTCKRLQQLAEIFFRQKFQDKIVSEVRIQVTFNGEILLLSEEEYVKYFLKLMRNVTLCDGFIKRPLDMEQFLRNNCNRNFCTIGFEKINFHKLLGAVLISWLMAVEGVEFYGCKNLHEILQFCLNLKSLAIDQYSKDNTNEWMEQRYPTLEHLHYDIVLPTRKLITFLTNNPNVTSLVVKLDRVTPAMNRLFIRELCNLNVEELMVTFDKFKDFEGLKTELQNVCNGGQFKRLELCFNSSGWSQALFDLNHLHGLHILSCDNMFPSNLTLEHLTVLQLADVFGNALAVALSKNLPNLEEFYLSFLSGNFQQFVAPFARNAVKLRKIVARDFKIPNRTEMTNARLAQYFNDEREQLVDACKLFIYFGKDEFDEPLGRSTPKFRLVEIKRVEFQSKRTSGARPYLRNFEF